MTTEWYYVAQGESRGPFPESDIIHQIRNGDIKGDTLVWTEGMRDWAPASDHFETRRRFGPASAAPAPPDGAGGQAGPWADRAPRAESATPGYGRGADGLYAGAPARGFVEAVGVCLTRYFKFSGRASRSEFWYFVLFGILAAIGAAFVDLALFDIEADTAPVSSVLALALFIPNFAVTVRRLHDTGRSGWWVGWMFFGPFVVMLAFGLIAGGGLLATPDTAAGAMLLLVFGWFGLALMVLIFMCLRGDPGRNRYG